MRRKVPLLFWMALLFWCSAYAWGGGIQKCVDADGKVAFSDKPCPTAATSETITLAPKPLATQQSAAQTFSDTQRDVCAATKKAMRDKTLPVEELEELKRQIKECVGLSALIAAASQQAAERSANEAEAQRAKIARMSPECQALWQEVVTLQTTIETPDEIRHYINRSDLYQSTCAK